MNIEKYIQEKAIFAGIIALVMPVLVSSGPYTAQMKNACPEGWENTSSIIPIIYASTEIPWKIVNETFVDPTDVNAVYSSLTPASIIATISPATQDDLASDPLTIASNCLIYRNFEVDTANYVAPVVTENLATGWIPAAIF